MQLTGKSWQLLPVVVELVNHIHHVRSNTSSRDHTTAITRSGQPRKPPLTILPVTVMKRECVEFQDFGRSRFICIYAELNTIQRAIEQTLEYLILCKRLAYLPGIRGLESPTSHASNLSTPFVFPEAKTIRG